MQQFYRGSRAPEYLYSAAFAVAHLLSPDKQN